MKTATLYQCDLKTKELNTMTTTKDFTIETDKDGDQTLHIKLKDGRHIEACVDIDGLHLFPDKLNVLQMFGPTYGRNAFCVSYR